MSEREIIMVAGKLRCKEILEKYRTTPAAVRAAELQAQIDRELRQMANARTQSLFRNFNE